MFLVFNLFFSWLNSSLFKYVLKLLKQSFFLEQQSQSLHPQLDLPIFLFLILIMIGTITKESAPIAIKGSNHSIIKSSFYLIISNYAKIFFWFLFETKYPVKTIEQPIIASTNRPNSKWTSNNKPTKYTISEIT